MKRLNKTNEAILAKERIIWKGDLGSNTNEMYRLSKNGFPIFDRYVANILADELHIHVRLNEVTLEWYCQVWEHELMVTKSKNRDRTTAILDASEVITE